MNTCVQCQNELEESFGIHGIYDYIDDHVLHFCKNPACPNYALLAIPLEDMPKDEALDTTQK